MVRHSVCMLLDGGGKLYLRFYDLNASSCAEQKLSDACERISRAKCGQTFCVSIEGRDGYDNRSGMFKHKTFVQTRGIKLETMQIDTTKISYRVREIAYDVVGSI